MAEGISIDLNVHDRGTAVVKKFGEALGSLFKKFGGEAASATGGLRGHLNGLTGSFNQGGIAAQGFGKSVSGPLLPLKLLAGAIATIGFGKLIGETIQVSQTMTGLQTAFGAAAGSAKEGAAEFEFVREQSERLGLEVTSTAGSYKNLLAAVVASGRSSRDAQTLFIGVAEAARAMGLSNEEAQGTFVAVQQIMSKGKVTAEELRQQLGERFPVAIGLMAKTLGVTTAELDKMMEQGELTADVMIPFAEELSKRFGPELAVAMASSGAQINRMKNAFVELLTAIGKGGLLDAVGQVAGSFTGLFKNMKESGAARELGEAFKTLGGELSTLISTYGPDTVKAITNIATAINQNLIPALKTMQTTSKEVGLALQTSFGAVGGWVNTAAKFYTDKVKAFVKGTAEELGRIGDKEAQARLDGFVQKLDGLSDHLGMAANAANDMRDKSMKALGDSKAETIGLTEKTKLTADEVRKLGDGAQVTAGKVVDAGEKMTEAIKEPGEAAKESSGAISGLAKAYSELGAKSGEDMQAAAMKSVEAFQTIANEGNETKERLAELFEPVAKDIIDAFGKVPPEMSMLFNDMKVRTGVDFRELATQGEDTAKSLVDNFVPAGKAIGDAIGEGADKAEQKLSALAQKMKDSKSAWEGWQAAWSGQTVMEYGNTIKELETQLQSVIQDRTNAMRQTMGNMGRGFEHFMWEQYSAIIEDIQGRIDALRQDEGSGSGSTGGSSSGYDTGIAHLGDSRRNGRTRTGSGSAGSGSAGSNDSLVLGGTGGGVSRAVGAGGSGAGTVIIEGAQFNINQNGIDPQAIDARGLVRAMLPALRE